MSSRRNFRATKFPATPARSGVKSPARGSDRKCACVCIVQLATLYHAAIASEGLMIELPVAEAYGETSHLQRGLVVAVRLKSVVIISVEIQWTTPWTSIGIN